MRFRFMIADLMILMLPAAAISYAIRYDPALLDNVIYGLYFAGLAATTLGAKFGRGRAIRKMFCKGAMLSGWFYLAFGLQFGFQSGGDRLLGTLIGLGCAILCGYATVRLTPRDRPRAHPPATAAQPVQ